MAQPAIPRKGLNAGETVVFERERVFGTLPGAGGTLRISCTIAEYRFTDGAGPKRTTELAWASDYTTVSLVGSLGAGGGGQIQHDVRTSLGRFRPEAYGEPTPFTARDLARVLDLWDSWHLNDLRAGTRLQDAVLDWFSVPEEYTEGGTILLDPRTGKVAMLGRPRFSHYELACEVLQAHCLYNDTGYKYGHAWLVEPCPQEVVEELKEIFSRKGEPC